VAERPRVVIAIPDSAESSTVAEWLSADGFEPVKRSIARAAADEIDATETALLIADAALYFKSPLHTHVRARHALMPTIVISDAAALRQEVLGGKITCLTRPVDRATFGCFVSMTLLDSRPPRRSVRKPVNRFDALVNGMPAHLVELSAEGVRLEMPRDSRAIPPYFILQVPLIGLTV
jgi:hypothetical protein